MHVGPSLWGVWVLCETDNQRTIKLPPCGVMEFSTKQKTKIQKTKLQGGSSKGWLHSLVSWPPPTLRSSFFRAGFELNYSEGVPKVTLNLKIWLTQRTSPGSVQKEEFFLEPNNHTKLKTGLHGCTKKEMEENQREEKRTEKAENKDKKTKDKKEKEEMAKEGIK